MRPPSKVKHYTAGDSIVVVDAWRPFDQQHGIREGEVYTCLQVKDGFTAIDNGTCVENGCIVDGYIYERFDKIDTRSIKGQS